MKRLLIVCYLLLTACDQNNTHKDATGGMDAGVYSLEADDCE